MDEVRSGGGIGRVQYPYGDVAWLVTGYEDVRTVYSQKAFSRTGMSQDSAPRLTAGLLLQGGIGSLDDSIHLKLRRVIGRELTSARMTSLRAATAALMGRRLAELAATGGGDYVSVVAKPFSLNVLGELVGIPESDQPDVGAWVSALLSDASASEAGARDAQAALEDLGRYVLKLLAARKADPAADFVSDLIRHGADLEKWEIVTVVFALVVGGYESSAHMLGKVILRLLLSPGLWTELRESPERIPAAVDELLRTITLAGGEGLPWRVREPVRLGGVDMAPGDYVVPAIGAANLDASVYPDPERIDTARNAKPHMAFGYGTRYCLGSPVARMELEVGIGALLRDYPDARLAVPPEQVPWQSGTAVWQLAELPIIL
ncbi:cytochrome P450 [Nocardia sp. 2]|uniref:Cytochrome P450 n=1 Tax=Nocardia acididurans TaxID=2802282 RepID=A0ABS1MA56_9NOCA|nr:cytochrome P450 [Nocardia acididurans]MBL1077525.1 cytochrome P450 [Nocardia acididurans]